MTISLFEKAGVAVTKSDTISNILKENNLDWKVRQKPLYTNEGYSEYPSYEELPGFVMNYRADTGTNLGIVNPTKYKVVQNVDAFNFIDSLENFTMEKVGAFNRGKNIFVIGKSNEQITLDGSDDPVNFYMTFLHGHTGKDSLRFLLCPIRMACMNQMNLMLKKSIFKYSMVHMGNVEYKLNQVHRHINSSKVYIKDLQIELTQLIQANTPMSIDDFVFKLIPENDKDGKITVNRKEETRESIIKLYKDKDDLQNYKGKSFGLLSAVSDLISHKTLGRKDGDINNIFIRTIDNNQLLTDAYNLLKAA
jgi:phage/plasmid-like protein (TIGR03299 family)